MKAATRNDLTKLYLVLEIETTKVDDGDGPRARRDRCYIARERRKKRRKTEKDDSGDGRKKEKDSALLNYPGECRPREYVATVCVCCTYLPHLFLRILCYSAEKILSLCVNGPRMIKISFADRNSTY